MRIRFINPHSGLQELVEIERVSFRESAIYLETNGTGLKKKCYFLHAPANVDKQEAYAKYIGLITSLGMNGYANLCFGEPTCVFDAEWQLCV